MIEYTLSDSICILRLAAPPVNTIGFSLLEALVAAVGRANRDPAVRGIVLTGSPDHFSAGADVGIFNQIESDEDAVHASRVFQDAFGEVEDSPKPIAAAVAGKVMGSALELAMACHARVCSRTATFSMPEVKLGFNPGAGGTQRLPRLLGLEPALKMLLTAQTLGARQALELGLVDDVCRREDLIGCATRLLESTAAPRKTGLCDEKLQDAEANSVALEQAEQSLASGREEIIAPRRILEAVRTGVEESIHSGMIKEQKCFAQCMSTLATRNKIYLFFATRQTGKVPELADVEPAEIAKAAVVGMGSMGAGIAQTLATAGVPVIVWDEDDSAVEKGLGRVGSSLARLVEQGRLDEARAKHFFKMISPASRFQEIAGAELVVEAVFEDAAVKREVIAGIENVCAPGTIIATNTSTISLDVLAEGMNDPDRLVGMHFFNPAHRMPLVEIIRQSATSAVVIATAVQLAKRLRKTPVLVKNREGFLVNRLFIPYLKEAFALLEDGAEAAAIDRAMVDFGFPMGPLVLIDMAGLDILVRADEVLSRAFPRHGPLSPIAVCLAAEGHLGQKTGRGVYRYSPGDYTPGFSDATERIIGRLRQQEGAAAREIGKEEITHRLVYRMIAEAFYVLEEGIAQRQSDLDVAMVLGAGFPDFRGGVVKYARDVGSDRVLGELDRLTERFGERFSPCKRKRTEGNKGNEEKTRDEGDGCALSQ